jgi:hypothetical protein
MFHAPVTSRFYYLVARNDRGEMRFGVKVEVLDPIAMTTVVAISVVILILLVVVVIAVAYAYR